MYMRMIPIEMMIVKADGFTMLNARMISAIVPDASAGTTGTRRWAETLAMARANGRLSSRAIEKRMRMLIAWMARQQTKIASATSASQMLPHVSPRTSFVIDVRPTRRRRLVDGHRAEADEQEAEDAGRQQRADQRLGAVLRGSAVSSASEPALSKPYIT